LHLESSTVLVTGGAGFIGSHLTNHLRRLGCQVIVLDNLSKGRFENIKDAVLEGDVKLVRGDVRRYQAVQHAVKDVDYVFHAAALVESRNPSISDSLFHETNATGTLNLLVASQGSNVKRFIYLSSAAVYGEPDHTPISEEARTEPNSFYGVSKLIGEQYCRLFNSIHGLGTISLRLFNVYGPGQGRGPYSGVITNFVERLLENKRPIIFGDGLQTRDFVDVSDVVQATIAAASSKPSVNGRAFNIGTGKTITIRSLFHKLALICDKRTLKPRYAKPRKGDIRRSCADTGLTERLLRFHCRVSLDQGLRDYVASQSL